MIDFNYSQLRVISTALKQFIDSSTDTDETKTAKLTLDLVNGNIINELFHFQAPIKELPMYEAMKTLLEPFTDGLESQAFIHILAYQKNISEITARKKMLEALDAGIIRIGKELRLYVA